MSAGGGGRVVWVMQKGNVEQDNTDGSDTGQFLMVKLPKRDAASVFLISLLLKCDNTHQL